MPKKLRLRELSEEEREEIARLDRSRTAPVRLVQRAGVIQGMLADPRLSAAQAGRLAGYKSELSGQLWVNRFKQQSLAGLQDQPRPGHPRVHREETRSNLVSMALQKPRTLGYPFELWTLERLQTAFKEGEGVHLSDSTIWTWPARRAGFP
jgi:transposase